MQVAWPNDILVHLCNSSKNQFLSVCKTQPFPTFRIAMIPSKETHLLLFHQPFYSIPSTCHDKGQMTNCQSITIWPDLSQDRLLDKWQVTDDKKWLDVIILNWFLWLMTVDLCIWTKTIQWNFNQLTSHHHEASHNHPPPHLTPAPSPTGTIPTVQANMPGAPWRKDLLDSALPEASKSVLNPVRSCI